MDSLFYFLKLTKNFAIFTCSLMKRKRKFKGGFYHERIF